MTVPSATSVVESAAPPARPVRRKVRTPLSAHGEPMVWLTGGALAVALTMIVVLLGFIFFQGISTFWPSPLVQLTLRDGSLVLGQVTRAESFRPEEPFFAALDPRLAGEVRSAIEAAGGETHRKLLRTGNFELTNTHFQWVNDILVERQEQPLWALLIERLSWGRFYGFPKKFLIDGKPVAETPETVWSEFQKHQPAVRRRWRERRSLEAQIGRVNDLLEDERLELRGIELRGQKGTPEWEAQQKRLREAQTRTEESVAEIQPRLRALADENARFQLLLSTADGQSAQLALADIVRAFPPNQLGTADKLGIYVSRWWEFLTDDPREANSEGGVYPAIFGTVLMTLLMTVAVVPFGVLAALYLREYSRGGPIVAAVRIAINNLAGVPSIVFGVFGLGFFCYIVGGFLDRGPSQPWRPGSWFVALGALIVASIVAVVLSWLSLRPGAEAQRRFGQGALVLWLTSVALLVVVLAQTPFFHGFFAARAAAGSPTFGKGGLIWASLTLALLTLPVVIVATEEALAAVPRSMREGSYACGAGKWQTIRRIVLPRAMPGIMTGMILAMARGAGEVAPLMLVGAAKLAPKLPLDGVPPFLHPQRSFMHLAFQVFDLGFQSPNSEAAKPMVFTTTLLLIAIIAMLNLAAIWLRTRLSRRFLTAHF
ncbi:MAG TPA: ABC transporter permease subunit [Pirellulales bacterium]|nr:ABC transporter permease subunit [Pirellulales bacterium]